MNLRVNHEEIDSFHDNSYIESEYMKEQIDFWLEKIDELKSIWEGEDADEFYENVTNYFQRMHVIPEFYDTVNEFVLEANKQYKNTDQESQKTFNNIALDRGDGNV